MPTGVSATDWTVLIGGQDSLASGLADSLALWQVALPRAAFETVQDAGRLMALSHPHIVAEALARGTLP